MATRRESHDADSLRIDSPFLRPSSHHTDGALRILERTTRRFSFGFLGTARHAILEDNASHADRVQPCGDFFAFQLPVKVPVTAARTNQHRRSDVLVCCWPVNRDGWIRD